MQLTRYTDYSLRVLLYLAVDQNRNPPVTVDDKLVYLYDAITAKA